MLNDFILDLKSKLDIDLLGIVKAKKLEESSLEIEENRKLGYYTEFESEDTDSRTNPFRHLENTKSIFVIGMSYIWSEKARGRYPLSNHVKGQDYHIVLGKKLEALKAELEKEFCFESYSQVDTGNLFEKELGRLAGFGFIGKNSLLINEEFGSYIALGLLLTDIEFFDYSQPVEGTCGSCDKCVKACPSKSIKGNYRIDSSSCHSYLSQSKVEIGSDQKFKYVYGCDLCQLVCPRNKDVVKNKHIEFKPKLENLDDIDIRKMSNKGFKREFKDFSFSWINRKLIVRNMDLIDKRG